MDQRELQLPHNHQPFIDRFVAACLADERVIAAFIGGSHVRGAADAYSDIDLCLITTDADYEHFFGAREAFLRTLGELVFLENFGLPNIEFFIFRDDTEGELWFGSRSHLDHIQSGPYRVLLDKQGILTGADFPPREPAQVEQIETLRRLVVWFWHDLSHFITALGRGQLYWAHGQLEALRLYCMNLARLRQNFFDADGGSEGYFKLEQAVPTEQLAPLDATYCPLEPEAMLRAVLIVVRYYQDLAPPLATARGIAYPVDLERVMLDRLERLGDAV
jgi:predicted nucleotidyltransferase